MLVKKSRKVGRVGSASRVWVAVVVGAMTLSSTVAGHSVARADVGGQDVFPISGSRELKAYTDNDANNGPDVVVASMSRTLDGGAGMHLFAKLSTTSNVAVPIEARVKIRCYERGTPTVFPGGIGQASINHSKNASAVESVSLNWGFVAPTRGTYTCEMRAQAAQNGARARKAALTAIHGLTYLAVGRATRVHAKLWRNDDCPSNGVGCSYVSERGAGGADSTFVFYTGVPVQRFTLPSSGMKMEFWSSLMLTSCYLNTGSCHGVKGSPINTDTAVVDMRFDVIQLNREGTRQCVVGGSPNSDTLWVDPAPGAGSSPDKNFKRSTVPDDLHHVVFNFHIDGTQLNPNCGRELIARLYVKHVSGQPVKIDGTQGQTTLTNIFGVGF